MARRIIVFGRKLCSGCQELKQALTEAGADFDYYSLDTPVKCYDKDDPASRTEWAKAREAYMNAVLYAGILNDPHLPIVVLTEGDPYDNASYERVSVLTEDGHVDLSLIPIEKSLKQKELL